MEMVDIEYDNDDAPMWFDIESNSWVYCDPSDAEIDRVAVDVVDRMMTDEKFYDNVVGWF
jgi:hypothetical protein